jgi:hypothetical protein
MPRIEMGLVCDSHLGLFMLENRFEMSWANRSLRVFAANPSTVLVVRPTFNTVSIMPGMEALAPDRTETSSGRSGSPNPIPIDRSTRFSDFNAASHMPGGYCFPFL